MKEQENLRIDPSIFWPAIILLAAIITPLMLYPDAGKIVVNMLLGWVTSTLGWLYLLAGIGSFFIMMWLAFGPFGHIRLGDKEDQPEFGKVTWVVMLFCAGIGISICYWAFVEPLYFLNSPPMGIEANSPDAVEWAAMYPMFHWGVVPWALYLIPALPIAYALYVRKVNVLRMSEACRGLLGDRVDGLIGKLIDVIVMFSIIGGVGTSLGLSVPLVSKLVQVMFGVQDSFLLQMGILAIWTAMIAWSVFNGLRKGIKTLSNVNAVLGVIMLFFVLLVGPTVFLLKLWTNSFGMLVNNFFHISFWTDPIQDRHFPENWTVFYWAWWVAYAPMMGLFVARISRGRTIRELILNGVVWGSVGCWAFFAIWGGYALDIQIRGVVDLQSILTTQGTPATIVAILKTMPLWEWVLPIFTLLCFVFLATTVDSSAYMLAAICTKELTGYQEPARWNRILWTLMVAAVGVALLLVGGLEAAQISTVLVALPMIPILVLMVISFIRWIHADFAEHVRPKALVCSNYKHRHPTAEKTAPVSANTNHTVPTNHHKEFDNTIASIAE
ncbi:BCCT family transporter [Paenalcaligenes sp. Me131]|uniref:BCCT family transporter n=1 Tax=Paenalcaligenes sp. Me131 TaxID=3392636 RepID=UPI003D2BE322